jgi:hypothetical protein
VVEVVPAALVALFVDATFADAAEVTFCACKGAVINGLIP